MSNACIDIDWDGSWDLFSEKIVRARKEHACRVTDCCGSYSTYIDKSRDPEADQVLCCKACYSEVGVGQGDGCEFRPGVDPDDYYQAVLEAEEQRFMYRHPDGLVWMAGGVS